MITEKIKRIIDRTNNDLIRWHRENNNTYFCYDKKELYQMSIQGIIEPFNKTEFIYEIININSKVKEIYLKINIENNEIFFNMLLRLFNLIEFKLNNIEKNIFDMF
jgi:hypothetical protein